MMAELAREWPGYGWETNRGYGTPEHYRALSSLGPTPLHRRSFAPVREIEAARAQPKLEIFEIVPGESFAPHTPAIEPEPAAPTQDVVVIQNYPQPI
jgi:ribonuclease HII